MKSNQDKNNQDSPSDLPKGALSPLAYYRQEAAAGRIVPNQAQAAVLVVLTRSYEQLTSPLAGAFSPQHARRAVRRLSGWLARLCGCREPRHKGVEGIYLWGGVGIGKSFLMDCLFQSLPETIRRRMHFHSFMQYVHMALKELAQHKNPLTLLGKQLASEVQVLYLDEFIVNDIADAMILKNTLRALFDHGVCVMATSNLHPDALYLNGLQREQFLPAIDWMKQHMQVVELIGEDHRKNTEQDYHQAEHYQTINLADVFQFYCKKAGAVDQENKSVISIHQRPIKIIQQKGDVLWIDFFALCDVPRSQLDYFELANRYHVLLISRVPVIRKSQTNLIRNFINLIDIVYDQGKQVIIQSETAPEDLYPVGELSFAFSRTSSRLIEMQAMGVNAMRR